VNKSRCCKAEQGFSHLRRLARRQEHPLVLVPILSCDTVIYQQTFKMDVSAVSPRTFQVARRAASGALAASRHAPNAGGITLPMAIWSRRQFSTGQGLSLPPPFTGLGGSSGGAHGSPSYFQRTQRLPTNTGIKFVPQQQAWVVERFGRFSRILEPGLAILIPGVDVRTA